jgi:hypothetical protein
VTSNNEKDVVALQDDITPGSCIQWSVNRTLAVGVRSAESGAMPGMARRASTTIQADREAWVPLGVQRVLYCSLQT